MKASVTFQLRGAADIRVLSREVEPRYIPRPGTHVEIPGYGKLMHLETLYKYNQNLIDVSLESIYCENNPELFETIFDACKDEGWTELEDW